MRAYLQPLLRWLPRAAHVPGYLQTMAPCYLPVCANFASNHIDSFRLMLSMGPGLSMHTKPARAPEHHPINHAARHCFGSRLLDRAAAPAQVCNVGFTTHAGTVAAADEWGEPVQRMAVKPSIPGARPLAVCGVGGPRSLPCTPEAGCLRACDASCHFGDRALEPFK